MAYLFQRAEDERRENHSELELLQSSLQELLKTEGIKNLQGESLLEIISKMLSLQRLTHEECSKLNALAKDKNKDKHPIIQKCASKVSKILKKWEDFPIGRGLVYLQAI